MNQAHEQFLNVPMLLERSQPRRLGVRLWQLLGVLLLVVMISTYVSTRSTEAAQIMNLVSMLAMITLIVALSAVLGWVVRRARTEQFQLDGIEELIRLRRWPEAGIALEHLLGRPTRTPQARVQGLIFLTGVLARYNRFDDAITVQNYLLDHFSMDGGTSHGLKLARAMAMLREDHLFDADRAINELRQEVSRAGRAQMEQGTPEQIPQSLSAGLAMIELYRDVKTGHPAEAIELFNSTLPALRDQLGHRVADAYALAAKAYDLLGRTDEARVHFQRATLLASPVELHRRFPETATLSTKYQQDLAPGAAEVQA